MGLTPAGVAELADATDSKSVTLKRCVGSTPSSGIGDGEPSRTRRAVIHAGARAPRAGQTFPLDRANDALEALKHNAIRGAAVPVM